MLFARTVEKRNRLCGRLGCRLEDIIKTNLTEMVWRRVLFSCGTVKVPVAG